MGGARTVVDSLFSCKRRYTPLSIKSWHLFYLVSPFISPLTFIKIQFSDLFNSFDFSLSSQSTFTEGFQHAWHCYSPGQFEGKLAEAAWKTQSLGGRKLQEERKRIKRIKMKKLARYPPSILSHNRAPFYWTSSYCTSDIITFECSSKNIS